MDLEHTKLGKHCEHDNCNQRDFLPFSCDYCSKNLCLDHRIYSAHACLGAQSKDMTSIDCPLCSISVKFPKSKNVDEVWQEHYLTSCKQSSEQKVVHRCFEASCQRVLGPSNLLTCGKCKQSVCLSHRVPEDHHCFGMRGAILSKLPPQQPMQQAKKSLTTLASKPEVSKPKPGITSSSSTYSSVPIPATIKSAPQPTLEPVAPSISAPPPVAQVAPNDSFAGRAREV